MKAVIFITLLVASTLCFAEEKKEEKKDDKKEKKDGKDAFGTVIGIDLGTTYSW